MFSEISSREKKIVQGMPNSSVNGMGQAVETDSKRERVWRLLLYYYFGDFATKRRTQKLKSLKIGVPKDIISHPSTIGNPPYIKIRRR